MLAVVLQISPLLAIRLIAALLSLTTGKFRYFIMVALVQYPFKNSLYSDILILLLLSSLYISPLGVSLFPSNIFAIGVAVR